MHSIDLPCLHSHTQLQCTLSEANEFNQFIHGQTDCERNSFDTINKNITIQRSELLSKNMKMRVQRNAYAFDDIYLLINAKRWKDVDNENKIGECINERIYDKLPNKKHGIPV